MPIHHLRLGESGIEGIRYQYKIQDHPRHGVEAPCKPTVVYFEDRNDDGEITEDAENPEVLQRELYYPFGMPLHNRWTKPGTPLRPTQDFLYNGKKFIYRRFLNGH